MRTLSVSILTALLLFVGNPVGDTLPAAQEKLFDVLPDMVPFWASDSLQDIRIDTARINDRLVSCKDWTEVDPTPITGQRVLSFRLGSPNFGQGHLRTRRVSTPEGWVFFQTTSQVDENGVCSATEKPIAVVPSGQTGRWLPLGKFALYQVTEEGGVGDQVACQIKRWCCLASTPTCAVNPPCSLPRQTDNIDAGTRDVYPFHWLDQFIPIEGVPSGLYWVEHEVNPGGVLLESDYENNSMLFQIELDQEAGTVSVTQPPIDPPQCPSGIGCR